MTTKAARDRCPVCLDLCPAEYAILGQEPHWRCLKCGAEGALTGLFSARKATAKVVQVEPRLKRHWKS